MIGVWLVVASAICFALAPIGAKFAYLGGGEPLTLSAVRFLLNFLAMWTIVVLGGHPYALPLRIVGACLMLGVLLAAEGVFYLSAVQYIPVSLAVVIVFTFPLQIGLIAALIGQERLTLARGVALVIAFLGVVLAVGVAADTVNWRGITLAAATGSGIAITAVSTSRLMRNYDAVTLTFYMTVSAATCSILMVLLWRGFVWPVTLTGWFGATGSAVCFGAALTLYFLGLARIGAVRAAIIGNLEPAIAIGAAVLVLSERPTFIQLVGAGMIIGSIFALHFYETRQRDTNYITSGKPYQ